MLITKMTFVKKKVPKLPSFKDFFKNKISICRQLVFNKSPKFIEQYFFSIFFFDQYPNLANSSSQSLVWLHHKFEGGGGGGETYPNEENASIISIAKSEKSND
jgi:hypothetical protein